MARLVKKIEWRGLDEQLDKLARFSQIAAPFFVRAMTDVVDSLAQKAAGKAPRASGELAGSIGGRVERMDGIQVEGHVGSEVAQALPMEFGTKPHRPPVEPVINWAGSKMGAPDPEQMGWEMAKLIEGGGLWRRSFVKKARKENQRFFYERLRQACNEAIEAVKL